MRLLQCIGLAALWAAPLFAQFTITSTFSSATVGAPYSVALTTSGGTAPYTWSVGNGLPPGLSLVSNSAISGTPTTPGVYNFNLTVIDARQLVASRAFSLTVSNGLLITTASPLPRATVGQLYSQPLTVTGGRAPYQWIASPGVPPGLSMAPDTGLISGIPTAAGAFSFQAQVSDPDGHTASTGFTMNVLPGLLSITTASPLFPATVGAAYSQTLSATGGTPPYTWSVVSGETGALKLNAATGALEGTPAAVGSLTFTIQVADSAGAKATQQFVLAIRPAALTITTSAVLADALSGTPYTQTIAATASGGTPPYSWSLGGAPAGLAFDAASMTLSGTPSAAGSFTLTLRVSDATGATATRNLTLRVVAAPLSITTARQLTAASLGVPFSQTIAASGGAPPYNWSAAGLPGGLAINPTTGAITGSPTTAGTFSPVVITVKDSALATFADNFSMAVSLPALPALTVTGLPATAGPAQQYPLQIALSTPYPAAISGQAVLSFVADSGPADSTMAFASGGTTAAFTIPAGAQAAVSTVPLAMQTGTSSGKITVTVRLQSGGIDITPATPPVVTAVIAPAAPVVSSAQFTRSGNTITVSVIGYATAREVTQAVFSFSAAAGQTLQAGSSSITVDTQALFGNWFGSSTVGGQFLFTQPFTIQGDAAAVTPVSVTLRNRLGDVTAQIRP